MCEWHTCVLDCHDMNVRVTHAHTHTHKHTYKCTHIRTHTHANTRTTHTYTQTHIHMYTHTHAHAYTHTHTHTHTRHHAHKHTHTLLIPGLSSSNGLTNSHECVRDTDGLIIIRMNVHMFHVTHTHTHICVYACNTCMCIYVCAHTCMCIYVWAHTCMWICIWIHVHTKKWHVQICITGAEFGAATHAHIQAHAQTTHTIENMVCLCRFYMFSVHIFAYRIRGWVLRSTSRMGCLT